MSEGANSARNGMRCQILNFEIQVAAFFKAVACFMSLNKMDTDNFECLLVYRFYATVKPS